MDVADLVSEVLENEGVLKRIRAELHANVLRVVCEDKSSLGPQEALTVFRQTDRQADNVLGVVAEMLSGLGLKHTLAVFKTEASLDKSLPGRAALMSSLKLEDEPSLVSNGRVLLPYILDMLILGPPSHSPAPTTSEPVPVSAFNTVPGRRLHKGQGQGQGQGQMFNQQASPSATSKHKQKASVLLSPDRLPAPSMQAAPPRSGSPSPKISPKSRSYIICVANPLYRS